ncbi:mechanosensitive ion channel family protein [Leeuwenhoekiella sp. NPDC079379]|uniref:mechanosensitive ion channel family protein n=1 Tax=Leeuwenhoekiella sp. NPDC079379 TaxID=3364122 RepID=UPI0037C8011D
MISYIDSKTSIFLVIILVSGIVAFGILFYILKKFGKSPRTILPVNFAVRIRIPLALFLLALILRIILVREEITSYIQASILSHTSTLLFIISLTWALILIIKAFKRNILTKYDMSVADNVHARKIYTQFTVLERVFIFLIILFAVSIALMSFDSIRAIGVSILTSAGIAGIIIGFAAQKALGTLMAGIQIAFTQPIRIDDVVVVEGEWGRIEEIYLTYVVVKIWDKRRLVLPTTYFIEKPFQNWTRNSSDILGTVFIYTDYNVPFDALRNELTRILENTDLWDGEVNVLQVTDTKNEVVETRALMSSKDSPTSWDLRVLVREKLVLFIQENYPHSLPRTRVEMQDLKNIPKSEKSVSEPEPSDLLRK